MEIVDYVRANWDQLVVLYFAAVGFASAIVKLTPTQKDDNILKKITEFVGKWVALNK